MQNLSKKEIENLTFIVKDRFLFHSWTPKAVFSLVASPLVKILLLLFIRWNKNRSYTEKVKYPLWLGGWVGAWLAILRIFNSISVISGRWTGDNEKLCAMEPCLRLERSPPRAGLEPRTAPSIGQGLTYWVTGAPRHWLNWADAQTDLTILRSDMLVFSNDVPQCWLVCIGRSIDWFESRLLEILDNEFINFFYNISPSKFLTYQTQDSNTRCWGRNKGIREEASKKILKCEFLISSADKSLVDLPPYIFSAVKFSSYHFLLASLNDGPPPPPPPFEGDPLLIESLKQFLYFKGPTKKSF